MNGMRKIVEPEAFVEAAASWIREKIDAVLQQASSQSAHTQHVNTHGSEGRLDHLAQIDVIEAYHR